VVADDPPPIGRSWTALYALVIGALVLWITLFWLFTKAFE
jgi:tetrahydromethanopterin S-methyltransferase subunit G